MKILFRYLSRYKLLIILCLILAAVDQIFINLNPYIFGTKIIDAYASKLSYFKKNGLKSEYFRGIFTGILMIVAVSTVAWISKGYQNYVLSKIIRKLGADLYSDVLRHVLQLPYEYFEDERSGEILSVLQRVRQDSESFLTKFVNVLFASSIALCVVIVISYSLDPLIPLIYILGALLLIFITGKLSMKIKSIQVEIVQGTNQLAGVTTESLRNISLIKGLGLIFQEINRLNKRNYKILDEEINKLKKVRAIGFVYGAFIQGLHQLIMFLLFVFLFNEKLTLGQLIMMQIYFYFVFGTLGEASAAIVSFNEIKVSLSNLDGLLKISKEYKPARIKKVGPIRELRFENVTFKYKSSNIPALNNLSFKVNQGDSIGIVGASGSGKTTIIKLIIGLYKSSLGKIKFNECGIDEVDMTEIRQQIALVSQDVQLFSGTIKENLLFVNPEASDTMIMNALHGASCQSILSRSDKGVETKIGEGGLKLSGGECQRLAIARALLRSAQILILDESTSALDSLTEKEIADTIKKLSDEGQYITLMIAHRLSTTMFADCIYVLSNGQIIEKGDHKELLAMQGLYYKMWQQQIGH